MQPIHRVNKVAIKVIRWTSGQDDLPKASPRMSEDLLDEDTRKVNDIVEVKSCNHSTRVLALSPRIPALVPACPPQRSSFSRSLV